MSHNVYTEDIPAYGSTTRIPTRRKPPEENTQKMVRDQLRAWLENN